MSTAASARSEQAQAFGGIRLLSVIPVLIGCLLSVLFFSVALRGITSTAPTTNAEGNQLHGTLRVQAGDALYLNFHEFPSIVTPYTPLYYVATGLASRVFSLDLPETLAFARAITLLAACGVVGMIYTLARTNGASQLAGITSASLFLPLPFLDRWAFTSRPDMVAILLSLIAAWIALRWPQRSSVAAIVAVVAILTKQTSVAVPAAITLWLWFGGNRRSAIMFVATWLACVVPTLFALNAFTEGNFLLNVFYAHLNPTNGFDAALRTILDLPTFAWPMLLLAAISVALELRVRKLGLTSIYWLIALAVLFYTLRGRGAAENYFIEPSALTCVLAASILSKVLRPASGVLPAASMLAVSVALAIWGWQTWEYWREGGELELDRPTQVPEIARAERIWAEEPSLVVFAGKPLLVSDPFLLSQMTDAGHFDPTFLADRVRARYFDLILVRGDVRQPRYLNGQLKWPEPVLKAVAEFYQRQGTRGPYWVYVPDRPRSAS